MEVKKVGRPRKTAIFSQTEVIVRIESNPIDAMLTLYCKQTSDEIKAGHVLHTNDRGFNLADSRKVSLWVEDIRNGTLLESHVETIAIVCSKYWGQLGSIWYKLPDKI